MAEVRETELPGVGVRYEFTTSSGEPVSVLVHRTGRARSSSTTATTRTVATLRLRLSADDALTLVEVLGASRVIASLAAAQQELAGLAIDWLTVVAVVAVGRTHAGRGAAIHTRTGVSVVAIIRGDEAIDAPRADTVLHAQRPGRRDRNRRRVSRNSNVSLAELDRMPLAATSSDVALVLVELGAIVFGLAIIARVSDRMGFSPIPFYLLAGLIFGEGGFVRPDFTNDFIQLGGEIGVVLLLLALGIEYTAEELTPLAAHRDGGGRARPRAQRDARCDHRRRCSASSPRRCIALGGRHLHLVVGHRRQGADRPRPPRQPRDADRALDARRSKTSRWPCTSRSWRSCWPEGAPAKPALSVAIAIAVLGGRALPRAAPRRVTEPVARRRAPNEALLLSVIGLTLLVAGLAQWVNISAAVGAFLVGIALSGSVQERAATTRSSRCATCSPRCSSCSSASRSIPRSSSARCRPRVALVIVTGADQGVRSEDGRPVATASPGAVRSAPARCSIARGEFSIVIAGLAAAAGASDKLGSLAAAYVLISATVGADHHAVRGPGRRHSGSARTSSRSARRATASVVRSNTPAASISVSTWR